MAYTIISESYGRRLPKISATADSADDLVSLGTDYAEGSTCVISDKTYKLDKVQGWTDGSGGGGGGGGGSFLVHITEWNESETGFTVDKTAQEIRAAVQSGLSPVLVDQTESEIHHIPFASSFYEEEGAYIGAVFSRIHFNPGGSTFMSLQTYTVMSEGGGPTVGTFERTDGSLAPNDYNASAGDVLTLNDSLRPEWQKP